MSATHGTNDDEPTPYSWTNGWEPVLSSEQVQTARCSDCGEPARYVRFHGPGGRSTPPHERAVMARLMCDSGIHEDCTGAAVVGGYGDIELVELADAREGPDWAQHLARTKSWWHKGGEAALRAVIGERRPR